jgi:hypothetical protein
MRNILIGLMMVAAAPAFAGPAEDAAARKELIATENAWAKAAVAGDIKWFETHLAPNWRSQDEKGITTRAELLDRFKSGKLVFKSMTNKNMNAFVSGDFGFVMGQDDDVVVSEGKTKSATTSWTDIYEKIGGKWVAIASQNTPMAAAKK